AQLETGLGSEDVQTLQLDAVFAAVGEPDVEIPARGVVPVRLDCALQQIEICLRNLVVRGDGADLIEQSLQRRRVAGLSGELPPGLQADFGVTQLLGQFERTLRPLAAAVRIGSRLAGEGEVAIRLGELAARRQRL